MSSGIAAANRSAMYLFLNDLRSWLVPIAARTDADRKNRHIIWTAIRAFPKPGKVLNSIRFT